LAEDDALLGGGDRDTSTGAIVHTGARIAAFATTTSPSAMRLAKSA
jgi:hypothetical protein